MARQEGLIKLKGRIGDLTFYETKDGYQARGKKGISGDRILNDPKFQRTRENFAEFGTAGKAGKLFRNVFKPYSIGLADRRNSNRLTKLMLAVVKADAVNIRGQRKVLDAETEMLQGFEFNINAEVKNVVSMGYALSIDRVTGATKISLPVFDPKLKLAFPQGATHFSITNISAAIDFETQEFEVVDSGTGNLPLDTPTTATIDLSCALAANNTHPMFLLMRIDFAQMVNGVEYALSNDMNNALTVALVNGV